MQSDSGLLGWLKVPSVYNVFSAAVGGNVLRRSLIQNHVRAKPGDKVIDIGCGSAQVLRYLPDVDYIGIDINQDYIAFARRTYGSKGTFLVGDTQSFRGDPRFQTRI
jgi:ubiquinone/menaquinone biosynthesis C-methylase UbiE